MSKFLLFFTDTFPIHRGGIDPRIRNPYYSFATVNNHPQILLPFVKISGYTILSASVFRNFHFFLNALNHSYFLQHLTESPIPDVPSTPERASTDALRVPEFGVDKIQEEDEVDSKYSFKRRTCVKYHMVCLQGFPP